MNSKLLTIAAGALLAACSAAAATDTYKITAAMPEEFDGLTAYLVNFDTGEKMDSAVIADNRALFNGTVAQPALARLIVDGNRMGSLIVEPGEITVDKGRVAGTPLNKVNADMQAYSRELGERFRALPDDSTSVAAQQAIMEEYEAYTDSLFKANVNNPVGYALFIDMAYSLSLDELQDMLKQYPVLKQYKRVEKLLAAAVNKQATQPGNKFVDFTIQNDSVKQSLSDFVGKGKPVLVDFWASWCGPCIRETKVIKEILEEYGPQGLEVLGVAVWDEPQNTVNAIKQHQLPWPQILNAQTVPTDLYGISGIPCIMIIGPDGTILSRDKQDSELKADVKAVMEGTLSPATFAAPAAPADSVAAGK